MTEGVKSDWDEARREKIARAREKGGRRRTYLLAGIMVAVIVAMVAAGVYFSPGAPRPLAPVQGSMANDYNGTMVSVPLSSVNQTARFYKWDADGKTVRFFAVLGSDGQVRTAFDNAYCCYRKDLGERQEGSDMVCNLCNKHYPIDELNIGNLNETMAKQCCPADLPHIVEGGNVLICKSDIAAGAYLFEAE
jgi:uncharacterized membrane protein